MRIITVTDIDYAKPNNAMVDYEIDLAMLRDVDIQSEQIALSDLQAKLELADMDILRDMINC